MGKVCIIAIHQPNFFPRLKILQKIAAADIWVVLDDVQYNNREWQNRTRVVSFHGENEGFWLTIPAIRPNGLKTKINEVLVMDFNNAAKNIRNTLHYSLNQAPYWKSLSKVIENWNLDSASISSLCVPITMKLLSLCGATPKLVFSNELSLQSKGSQLIADICRRLEATTYLADSGATNYLNASDFRGKRVLWQHWKEPDETWPGITSWRDLSSINYLAREGENKFKQHIGSIMLLDKPPITIK